jgi:hypothetical protein
MKLSELINGLTDIKNNHGDLEIQPFLGGVSATASFKIMTATKEELNVSQKYLEITVEPTVIPVEPVVEAEAVAADNEATQETA